MGLWMGHIQKERIVFVAIDKVNTLFSDLLCQVGLVNQSIDNLIVPVQW